MLASGGNVIILWLIKPIQIMTIVQENKNSSTQNISKTHPKICLNDLNLTKDDKRRLGV